MAERACDRDARRSGEGETRRPVSTRRPADQDRFVTPGIPERKGREECSGDHAEAGAARPATWLT